MKFVIRLLLIINFLLLNIFCPYAICMEKEIIIIPNHPGEIGIKTDIKCLDLGVTISGFVSRAHTERFEYINTLLNGTNKSPFYRYLNSDKTIWKEITDITKKKWESLEKTDITEIDHHICSRLSTTDCFRNVYILYRDEAFKELVLKTIKLIGKNKIGKQLLLDIVLENIKKGKKEPVFIFSKDILDTLPQEFSIDKAKYTISKEGKAELINSYKTTAPYFRKADENIRINFVLYKDISSVNYPAFRNDDIQKILKHEKNVPIKLFPTPMKEEDDIGFFHELNHYRHYMQGDFTSAIDIKPPTQNVNGIFHGIHMSFIWNPMYSAEEELQLSGYATDGKKVIHYDFINETAYRYYYNKDIRFPYISSGADQIVVPADGVKLFLHRALLGSDIDFDGI